MAALTGRGYSCRIAAYVLPSKFRDPHIEADENGIQINYVVEMIDWGYDSVDLRTLCDIAEGLGMEAVMGKMGEKGSIHFQIPANIPEVLRSPRRHPR